MSKWIYKKNADNTERYVLGEEGEKMLACIGINPSTAKPDALDNTLNKVKNIVEFNGYDGWVMFNVYPQRATKPKDMDKKINKKSAEKNIEEIIKTVKKYKIETIWLVFGNNISTRAYLFGCLKEIYNELSKLEFKFKWKIIGKLTKECHPRHPLYQKKYNKLIDFDMDAYIKLWEYRP